MHLGAPSTLAQYYTCIIGFSFALSGTGIYNALLCARSLSRVLRLNRTKWKIGFIRSCRTEPARNHLARPGTARPGTARHGPVRCIKQPLASSSYSNRASVIDHTNHSIFLENFTTGEIYRRAQNDERFVGLWGDHYLLMWKNMNSPMTVKEIIIKIYV